MLSITNFDDAGVPESLLLGQLDAVSPQNARDLLRMLSVQGLFGVRTCSMPAVVGPPSIFGICPSTAMTKVFQRPHSEHIRLLLIVFTCYCPLFSICRQLYFLNDSISKSNMICSRCYVLG